MKKQLSRKLLKMKSFHHSYIVYLLEFSCFNRKERRKSERELLKISEMRPRYDNCGFSSYIKVLETHKSPQRFKKDFCCADFILFLWQPSLKFRPRKCLKYNTLLFIFIVDIIEMCFKLIKMCNIIATNILPYRFWK